MQSVPETVLMSLPAGACLTLDALEARFELSRQQLSNAIGRLVVRGLVERAQAGCYQLTNEGVRTQERGRIAMPPREDMQSVPETVLMNLPADVCLTLDALEARFELSRQQLSNAIGRLVARGLIERAQAGCYQLTKEGQRAKALWRTELPLRRKPPMLPSDTFLQRIWVGMRMSGVFTIGDLITTASWPSARAEERARSYVRQLKAAGYVVELPVRHSIRCKRFRLLRNTGPFAPVYRRGRDTIRDLNTREEVPCVKPF